MWDRRMIGVPNRPGKKTIEIDLDPVGWPVASVAHRRQADVGHPALTYVTVLSAVEAAKINADFKRQAEEELRATLAEEGEGYIGQNIDEEALEIVHAWLEAEFEGGRHGKRVDMIGRVRKG